MKMRCMLPGLLLFASPAFAGEVVFYRCTDASGGLTVQNMPCPKGSKQEKKVMEGITTVPMGTPTPPAPARPTPAAPSAPAVRAPAVLGTQAQAQPEPAIDDAARIPPPVLFQCITYDKDSYITEDEEPQSRCVALQTVGLDGNPEGGAGEACEVRRDTCARVADGALCEAWTKRLGETEVAWRFGKPENMEKNKAEFERVRSIVNESTCGLTPKP